MRANAEAVSIPLRYADNFLRERQKRQTGENVSIPLRYADNIIVA